MQPERRAQPEGRQEPVFIAGRRAFSEAELKAFVDMIAGRRFYVDEGKELKTIIVPQAVGEPYIFKRGFIPVEARRPFVEIVLAAIDYARLHADCGVKPEEIIEAAAKELEHRATVVKDVEEQSAAQAIALIKLRGK
ncbi:hypothetical protein HYS54_02745 [Candidatus Micrarchaeota archaeon]|nr:hypothetical protein [Candidatus Micrarchaeota archaeon]